MSASFIFIVLISYFLVLLGISYFTSKDADNQSFFLANRKSPWYLVAFGMIGVSLSGITFISIPGWVGNTNVQFGYMQMVFGYFFGYLVISYVLMPVFYRMKVVSIYSYLGDRFGYYSHKIGAFYFLISRISGAAIRLLLVANVLQEFVFSEFGIPFEVTVAISILLIWVYTYKGGIKTIIWTDTLQTLFMLVSLGLTVWILSDKLNLSETGGLIETVKNSQYSKIFFFEDWKSASHFSKMFLGGMFISIGMTGLDQDMMQKNLSCVNIKSAQKNMISFSVVLVVVNLVFLCLGALLYMYAGKNGISVPVDSVTGKKSTDLLFPFIALKSNLGLGVGVLFLLGLIAAAYSSADSALTSLTTSVCIDFIETKDKKITKRQRFKVHILMSMVLLITVIVFKYTLDKNAIDQLLSLAVYTYGPLIGLFFFGMLTKLKVRDNLVIVACLLAPLCTYIIGTNSANWFDGFSFGKTLIIVNALFTFIFLLAISKREIEV